MPGRQIGGALGDAMSQNVLQRILARVLYCAGLMPAPVADPWELAATSALAEPPKDAWSHIMSKRTRERESCMIAAPHI